MCKGRCFSSLCRNCKVSLEGFVSWISRRRSHSNMLQPCADTSLLWNSCKLDIVRLPLLQTEITIKMDVYLAWVQAQSPFERQIAETCHLHFKEVDWECCTHSNLWLMRWPLIGHDTWADVIERFASAAKWLRRNQWFRLIKGLITQGKCSGQKTPNACSLQICLNKWIHFKAAQVHRWQETDCKTKTSPSTSGMSVSWAIFASWYVLSLERQDFVWFIRKLLKDQVDCVVPGFSSCWYFGALALSTQYVNQ